MPNRIIIRLAVSFILLSLVALAPVATAHDDALRACASIASALERLDCYDAFAKGLHAPAATFPAAPPQPELPPDGGVAQPASATSPSEASATTTPATYVTPNSSRVTQSSGDDDRFGFEAAADDDTTPQIVTHYEGVFTGWSGNTLFQLANGQVWKQSQSGRVSYRRDGPTITIRRGAFGSYRLSVEGLNRSVRVERVR